MQQHAALGSRVEYVLRCAAVRIALVGERYVWVQPYRGRG